MPEKNEQRIGHLGLEEGGLNHEEEVSLQKFADIVTRELLAEIIKLKNLRIKIKTKDLKSEIAILNERGTSLAAGELTLAKGFEAAPIEIEEMITKLLDEVNQLDPESIRLDFLKAHLILRTENFTLELARLISFTQNLPTNLRKKLILLERCAQEITNHQNRLRQTLRELTETDSNQNL
ncbi:MAG: hypothetical protein ACD_65C00021G0003 [uncultured bacterium]|nr:MAG: hypothetical protein ACD_65C00021G0003 [uncultured bacterium]